MFSANSNYEFNHWNFAGNSTEEYTQLINILRDIGKEVYISQYNELGCNACRIIVPNFSEIYSADDLIWDNNNKAINIRESILTIHQQSTQELQSLLTELEEQGYDDYMPVMELIGVSFDENTPWGELTVGELKLMIHLKNKNFESAKEYIDIFLRLMTIQLKEIKLYRLISIILDIKLMDENIEDYQQVLSKTYGDELFLCAQDIIESKICFYGLFETDMNFSNNKKHLELIKSYKKLRDKRIDYTKKKHQ